MSVRLVEGWLRRSALLVADRRSWLTDLDAAIGDGDHGINLDRGLQLVVEQLGAGNLPVTSAGLLLVGAGRTILGTVGGASGALYGRAFIRAGERLDADPTATGLPPIVSALTAAVDAIGSLGRSRPGQKTMLDALDPAGHALRVAAIDGRTVVEGLAAAALAAEAGAEATVPMLATKGRASYLGGRSVGHLDPGAASSALLLSALARVAAELETASAD
ncbi:MAG TPA: dihydroxyacetone kinase subunit DhaL [Candidatus Limnocylindrales bacterium]